jgi:hypothetical protein
MTAILTPLWAQEPGTWTPTTDRSQIHGNIAEKGKILIISGRNQNGPESKIFDLCVEESVSL